MKFDLELKQISKVLKEDRRGIQKDTVKLILKGENSTIDARLELSTTPDEFKSFAQEYLLNAIGSTINLKLEQKQTKLSGGKE